MREADINRAFRDPTASEAITRVSRTTPGHTIEEVQPEVVPDTQVVARPMDNNNLRLELTAVEAKLRDLNQHFPGERKKHYELRDPQFREKQAALTNRRLSIISNLRGGV